MTSGSGRSALALHDDRYFDADPAVRRAARAIHDETRALPLICPHGHVDPHLLADDTPFSEPTSLFLLPDHYILRMLYSRAGRYPREEHTYAIAPEALAEVTRRLGRDEDR